MHKLVVAALLCLFWAGPAGAEDIHGRIEIQDVGAFEGPHSLSAALGERNRNDVLGDLRLTWEPNWEQWSFALVYELNADFGDTPALARRLSALGLFPQAPPSSWWALSNTFENAAQLKATQKLDRLWLGYSDTHLVVRLGRQALSWGSGLVFRPMDLFSPFAPNATDTEYKPGTDFIYGQWLFDDGSDLQFVVAPRPVRVGGAPTANASSAALLLHTQIGTLQTTWLLARDRRDWLAGVGVNGSLGQATWNVEVIPTFVHRGPTVISGLANISDATTVFGRDVTLFAEYYRNGFGLERRHYALIDLPVPLRDRLLRGQLFDTGRDYLAVGALLQYSPLLQINPTVIANLDDRSLYTLVQATYSLRENLNLVVGSQLKVGPSGTEFGGLPLIDHFPIFVEQPKRVYVQLRQYF